MAKKAKTTEIDIQELRFARVRFNIIGVTPMIMHRFDKKAWQELLLPKAKSNRADREQSLKHDPIAEFRGACYRNRDDSEPALFHIPGGTFKAAIDNAALDLPGASKSQIKRLTTINTPQINFFGIPRLGMDMVRSSDMARTPDVRTRPYFPEWACTFEVEYPASLIRETNIGNLLAAAGKIGGAGDWRPQKGGSFGKFMIVDDNDVDFKRIIKTMGRKQQEEAFDNPVAYDADTEELLDWFMSELKMRERELPSSKIGKAKAAAKVASKLPAIDPHAVPGKSSRKNNGRSTAI